ncbi:MAG: hypothetical protein IT373_16260 [Polyangiaceae bacterium]|nr:hypothetical protein [Polyangiaceae bacterium]
MRYATGFWVRLSLAACGGAAVAACGGKAVIDADTGTGGAGGGTTSTTTTTTTTTTATTCDGLQQALQQALDAAVACDPLAPVAQCDGTAFVRDFCDCQVLANEKHPDAVATALAAYDAWTALGCGPWLCEWCPPTGAGFCDSGPAGGVCTVVFGG